AEKPGPFQLLAEVARGHRGPDPRPPAARAARGAASPAHTAVRQPPMVCAAWTPRQGQTRLPVEFGGSTRLPAAGVRHAQGQPLERVGEVCLLVPGLAQESVHTRTYVKHYRGLRCHRDALTRGGLVNAVVRRW